MKFDLGFGNSVCVRDAFLAVYHGDMIVFTEPTLHKMDYPERDGDPELIALTKEVIERQTGDRYKYVIPTNGATGGVVIALRALAQMGYRQVFTRPAPWYLRYPSMFKAAGVVQSPIDHQSSGAFLLDYPSNPLNLMEPANRSYQHLIVDGVYLNRVYTDGGWRVPYCDALVGSYSKLLGLNGIRIGWVATNNPTYYERMRELAIGEYCGLSVPSTDIIKNVLFKFDWENFEIRARALLDFNRESWSKLEKYFGDKPVDKIGMFYYGPTDAKCRELLFKAGIKFTPGSSLGTTDEFGRFNLGQGNQTIDAAVKAMLDVDAIK